MIPCIFCDRPFETVGSLKLHSATCHEHPAVREKAESYDRGFAAGVRAALEDREQAEKYQETHPQ